MSNTKINDPISIGIVLFSGVTQLDFTQPYEVFTRFPYVNLYLISESLEPIRSDRGRIIWRHPGTENSATNRI